MRCLTLTQPFATLVSISAKQIETRSWGTSYRGQLAIHAAKGFPGWCRDLCDEEPFRAALLEAGYLNWRHLPVGAVLAVGELYACRRIVNPGDEASQAEIEQAARLLRQGWNTPPGEPERSFGDYAHGRFAWLLTDVQPLSAPIPAKGSLGLWDWQP